MINKLNNTISILKTIPDLNNKKVLSIGCGSGHLEHYLKKNNITSDVDCINKPGPSAFPSNNELLNLQGFNFEICDFVTYSFKKKYDVLLFVNSLQFILGESSNTLDENYFEHIKQKITNLLNENGYIYIEVTSRKWFMENKQCGLMFLDSLDNCIENILKMNFEIRLLQKSEEVSYVILQKNI